MDFIYVFSNLGLSFLLNRGTTDVRDPLVTSCVITRTMCWSTQFHIMSKNKGGWLETQSIKIQNKSINDNSVYACAYVCVRVAPPYRRCSSETTSAPKQTQAGGASGCNSEDTAQHVNELWIINMNMSMWNEIWKTSQSLTLMQTASEHLHIQSICRMKESKSASSMWELNKGIYFVHM